MRNYPLQISQRGEESLALGGVRVGERASRKLLFPCLWATPAFSSSTEAHWAIDSRESLEERGWRRSWEAEKNPIILLTQEMRPSSPQLSYLLWPLPRSASEHILDSLDPVRTMEWDEGQQIISKEERYRRDS